MSVPSASGANAGGDRRRRAAARAARHARRDPTGCGSTPNAEFSVDEPIANSSMLVLPIGDEPGRLGPGDAAGVVERQVALEDARPRGRLLARRAEDVLERDRHALEPGAALAVEPVGLGERRLAARAQEGVDARRPAARSGRGRPSVSSRQETSRASSSSTQRSAVRPSVSIIAAGRRHPEAAVRTVGGVRAAPRRAATTAAARRPRDTVRPSSQRVRRRRTSVRSSSRSAPDVAEDRRELLGASAPTSSRSASAAPAGRRAGRRRR